MRLLRLLSAICLVSVGVFGKTTKTDTTKKTTTTDSDDTETTTTRGTSIANWGGDLVPTTGVTYLSYTTTIIRTSHKVIVYTGGDGTTSGSTTSSFSTTTTSNASTTATDKTTTKTTKVSVTILVGKHGTTTSTQTLNGTTTTTANETAASTSSAPVATNTQPCNDYAEFCSRKFSNITFVAAHNSPFVRASNAAANQALGVTDQLDDGIRMLQGQTHYVNGTVYYCHTSCSLLNAGTAEDYFRTVAEWISKNPYDVVAILIGNGDYIKVTNYTAPIQNSGLGKYAYEPPKIPMSIDDWPTLSELILTGKRAIIFMDYKANQTEVPYILDEFSQLWETPFDPTDRTFPCTVQRPPNISRNQSLERMYMANHNLNMEITMLGIDLLVPNLIYMNQTNNVTGYGSLGLAANNCAADWGRPPNFLLVDYYNVGNGSVFEVAARLNNVTYNRKCCGVAASGAQKRLCVSRWMIVAVVVLIFSL